MTFDSSKFPQEMAFYVHALQNGNYYVGITRNISKRDKQHEKGKGSVWTKLHPPVGKVDTRFKVVSSYREAEILENKITIDMMVKFGWRKVRGGFFCEIDEMRLEQSLRAHGFWDLVFSKNVPSITLNIPTWPEAIKYVLDQCKQYYLEFFPESKREALQAAFLGLRMYPEWNSDFEPSVGPTFWDKKGIFHTLLSIYFDMPLGSKLPDTYGTLCAGMLKGKNGIKPWQRLFLIFWFTYKPEATQNQQNRVNEWLHAIDSLTSQDHQYNAFLSVAFPETRWLIRRSLLGEYLRQ